MHAIHDATCINSKDEQKVLVVADHPPRCMVGSERAHMDSPSESLCVVADPRMSGA